ncbi:hypothetical protein EIP91_012350 [Steccherinum ochraceum]|uniref:Uncharacterized protein n=1 Tax=Steccherinum ochraceum TaxID=92696 RepID=A0A4R0RQ54_9APHY|nr:hypothetical protein EIP91_012350 [Steccherinum ochraceum]
MTSDAPVNDAVSKHIVHTQVVTTETMPHRVHPVISSRHRFQLPVGDQTGLTKTGVHFCRLPPSTTSTTLHWHTHEDEWFYIIDAADDAALLIMDDEARDGVTREVGVAKGDFIGFPAGVKLGHGLRSGKGELVYLMGGSREPLDVSNYPEAGRRRVISRNGPYWAVDEMNVIPQGTITARDVQNAVAGRSIHDIALREVIEALQARDFEMETALTKRLNAPPSRPSTPNGASHPNGAANGATNGATNGANGHPNGATNGANGAANGANGSNSGQSLPSHFPPALTGQVGTAQQPHTPNVVNNNPAGNAQEQSAPVEEWPERRMYWARGFGSQNALRKRLNAPPSRPPTNGATNGANGHPNGANGATNGANGATNGANGANGHPTNGANGGQQLPSHFPPALTGQVGTAQQPQTPNVVNHNPAGNAQEQSAPVEEWPERRMF